MIASHVTGNDCDPPPQSVAGNQISCTCESREWQMMSAREEAAKWLTGERAGTWRQKAHKDDRKTRKGPAKKDRQGQQQEMLHIKTYNYRACRSDQSFGVNFVKHV